MIRETLALTGAVGIFAAAAMFGPMSVTDGSRQLGTRQSQEEAIRTPEAQLGASTRAFRCMEDEDIVITLGENGLPYAFCEQVIER